MKDRLEAVAARHKAVGAELAIVSARIAQLATEIVALGEHSTTAQDEEFQQLVAQADKLDEECSALRRELNALVAKVYGPRP